MKVDERILKAFGKNLQKLREGKDWTQLDLAYRIESSTSHISRLENGHTEPGLLMLFALAKALEVPVEELVKLK